MSDLRVHASLSYLQHRGQRERFVAGVHLHDVSLSEKEFLFFQKSEPDSSPFFSSDVTPTLLTMLRTSVVSPRPLTLSASVRLSTTLSVSSPVGSDEADKAR